jgi:hypothetical protein
MVAQTFYYVKGQACFTQPIALAVTSSMIDWKIRLPSVPPTTSSQARSGWGIIPRTLPALLTMPAILFRAPLGFASGVISPEGVQ